MNDALQKFARDTLKAELALLNHRHHTTFKLMYSHRNLDKPINDVVDDLPEEQLDWAMQQVHATLKKLKGQ
jgi:hypothetical protein